MNSFKKKVLFRKNMEIEIKLWRLGADARFGGSRTAQEERPAGPGAERQRQPPAFHSRRHQGRRRQIRHRGSHGLSSLLVLGALSLILMRHRGVRGCARHSSHALGIEARNSIRF